MVKNAARNRRRRRYLARPHVELDELPSQAPAGDETIDDVLGRAEEHVRLRACVEELCEIQKAVVTLRMLEEQPGEDVARALGISAGARGGAAPPRQGGAARVHDSSPVTAAGALC